MVVAKLGSSLSAVASSLSVFKVLGAELTEAAMVFDKLARVGELAKLTYKVFVETLSENSDEADGFS